MYRHFGRGKKTLEVYRSEDIESTPDEVFLVGYPEKVDVIKSELAQSLRVPTRYQLSNYITVPEIIRAEKDIVSHEYDFFHRPFPTPVTCGP